MGRRLFTLSITVFVVLQFAPAAVAIGPGGWSHVGVGATSSQSSLNGTVTSLNTDNPGVLYAGGVFTDAGGKANADHLARWNGTSWSAVNGSVTLNGSVDAIAYHAGKVYVGGQFTNVGGNANIDYLAEWDGSSWTSPCAGTAADPITARVAALTIVGNTLYVGGAFQDGAGIPSADYLVGCDLTTGEPSTTVPDAAHSINAGVYALTADSNGTLYAGGGFIDLAGNLSADHVAAYEGGTWHAMGGDSAVNTFVRSLIAVGTEVYVGTDAVDVSGIATADHVARWNGTSWSAVGADSAGTNGWFPASTTIDALAHYGSTVLAAGSFQNADGIATADQIAYFDGTQWRPIGSNGSGNGPLSGHPVALAVTGGNVYTGGNFTSAAGDTRASYLAAYALRLPDAAITGTASGVGVGNNVYSPTGVGEQRAVDVRRGTAATAYVRIQNNGLVPASFRVTGAGGASGITAHWFAGANNLTGQVVNGTYATATIAAGSHTVLRLRVVVTNSSASHATITTVVRPLSGSSPDAVRFSVTATR